MNREVIATGTSKGENLIVRVIEKEDKEIEVRVYVDSSLTKELVKADLIGIMMKNSTAGMKYDHSYNPEFDSLEAYLLALHDLEYFDSEPDFEFVGDISDFSFHDFYEEKDGIIITTVY